MAGHSALFSYANFVISMFFYVHLICDGFDPAARRIEVRYAGRQLLVGRRTRLVNLQDLKDVEWFGARLVTSVGVVVGQSCCRSFANNQNLGPSCLGFRMGQKMCMIE